MDENRFTKDELFRILEHVWLSPVKIGAFTVDVRGAASTLTLRTKARPETGLATHSIDVLVHPQANSDHPVLFEVKTPSPELDAIANDCSDVGRCSGAGTWRCLRCLDSGEGPQE